MNKKTFKLGENISPEFLNGLMDLSYSKSANEVGHLPLPPDYGIKPDVFKTSDGVVNLATSNTEIVFLIHEITRSSSSQQIQINGIADSKAHTIVLITRGYYSKLNVSLPKGSSSREIIELQRGSDAIFTFFNDGTDWNWKYFELEYEFQRPTPHNIDLNNEDPIELVASAEKKVVIHSSYLQINQGKFDATLEFLLDCYNQSFAGDFFVELVDDNNSREIITKHYHLLSDQSLKERIFSMRFVSDVEIGSELSIKAWFASQSGSVSIKKIKLSGFWAGSDPE